MNTSTLPRRKWDRKSGTLLARARRRRALAKRGVDRVHAHYTPGEVKKRYDRDLAKALARLDKADAEVKSLETLARAGVEQVGGQEVGSLYTERSGHVPPAESEAS